VTLAAATLLAWAAPSLTQEPAASPAEASPTATAAPQVTFETSMGIVLVELDPEKAPLTVANVLEYARSGFYDGTVFHRVIDGFMIQGGGFTEDLKKKDTRAPVRNESHNGLSNVRGTLSMARTQDPHSATAQFYINLVDNLALDAAQPAFPGEEPRGGWGYTVFGRVLEGMDVVDAIAKVKTGPRPNGMRDVPLAPVKILKATVN
jgi:cyclophilin family peptidyl-prolyl cis-trans isomerase